MPDDLGYDTLDDDDLDTQDTGPGDNNTIKAIRKAQRDALARAKAAEAEAAELRAWKQEQEVAARKAQVGAIAQQLGLPAGQAALVPSDVEPTAEAVRNWAVDHDLLAPATPTREAASEFFVPVTGPGGVAPDLTVDRATWEAMYRNPATRAQAEAMFNAGRVSGFDTPIAEDENGVTYGKVPY